MPTVQKKKKQRVWLVGLSLVHYIGLAEVTRVGRELRDKVTLHPGDYFVCSQSEAVHLHRTPHYKIVHGVKDLDAFLSGSYEKAVDPTAPATGDGELTIEGLMTMKVIELKKLCKSKKIKYGKLSKDEMIGVLIPRLGL
ncbi:MAG: hypothetical protein HF962_00525 [Sulfurovum sp.]|nr:hypothetical protein [Sulfurovum sp.]